MIQGIPCHGGSSVIECKFIAANRKGSEGFFDVTADRGIRMNSEVYMAVVPAHIELIATKLKGRHYTVVTDNDLKHTYYKSRSRIFEGKEIEYSSTTLQTHAYSHV